MGRKLATSPAFVGSQSAVHASMSSRRFLNWSPCRDPGRQNWPDAGNYFRHTHLVETRERSGIPCGTSRFRRAPDRALNLKSVSKQGLRQLASGISGEQNPHQISIVT